MAYIVLSKGVSSGRAQIKALRLRSDFIARKEDAQSQVNHIEETEHGTVAWIALVLEKEA